MSANNCPFVSVSHPRNPPSPRFRRSLWSSDVRYVESELTFVVLVCTKGRLSCLLCYFILNTTNSEHRYNGSQRRYESTVHCSRMLC